MYFCAQMIRRASCREAAPAASLLLPHKTRLSHEFSVIRRLKWIQSTVSQFHGLDVDAVCSGRVVATRVLSTRQPQPGREGVSERARRRREHATIH